LRPSPPPRALPRLPPPEPVAAPWMPAREEPVAAALPPPEALPPLPPPEAVASPWMPAPEEPGPGGWASAIGLRRVAAGASAAAEGTADRVHGHQGWEAVDLCHRSQRERRDPVDEEPRGGGFAAGVVPRRLQDRLHEHAGRQPADLPDERRREQPAPLDRREC